MSQKNQQNSRYNVQFNYFDTHGTSLQENWGKSTGNIQINVGVLGEQRNYGNTPSSNLQFNLMNCAVQPFFNNQIRNENGNIRIIDCTNFQDFVNFNFEYKGEFTDYRVKLHLKESTLEINDGNVDLEIDISKIMNSINSFGLFNPPPINFGVSFVHSSQGSPINTPRPIFTRWPSTTEKPYGQHFFNNWVESNNRNFNNWLDSIGFQRFGSPFNKKTTI